MRDAMAWVTGLGLYGFLYSMTAVFLRTTFLARWLSAKFTGLAALFLLAVGSVVPYLAGFLIFYGSPASSERTVVTLLGNPFALNNDPGSSFIFLIFAGAWSALAALLNLGWFHQAIVGFRPPEAKAPVEAVGEVA